jgi:hypothetical protein
LFFFFFFFLASNPDIWGKNIYWSNLSSLQYDILRNWFIL